MSYDLYRFRIDYWSNKYQKYVTILEQKVDSMFFMAAKRVLNKMKEEEHHFRYTLLKENKPITYHTDTILKIINSPHENEKHSSDSRSYTH